MSCGIHTGPCGWTRAKGCPIAGAILAELDREEFERSVYASRFFEEHEHPGGPTSRGLGLRRRDPQAHREAQRRWREKKRRQRAEGRAV